jgi:hypothetical protein
MVCGLFEICGRDTAMDCPSSSVGMKVLDELASMRSPSYRAILRPRSRPRLFVQPNPSRAITDQALTGTSTSVTYVSPPRPSPISPVASRTMPTPTNLERAINAVLRAEQPLAQPAVFAAYCRAAGHPFASTREADGEPELLDAAVRAFERALDKSACGRLHAPVIERVAREYWRQKHGADWDRCEDGGCACRAEYADEEPPPAGALYCLGFVHPACSCSTGSDIQNGMAPAAKTKRKRRSAKRKVNRVAVDPYGPSTSSCQA